MTTTEQNLSRILDDVMAGRGEPPHPYLDLPAVMRDVRDLHTDCLRAGKQAEADRLMAWYAQADELLRKLQ